MQSFFVTGIGTDVGKTVVSAILADALGARYWKPIQAGHENGTDSEWVKRIRSFPGAPGWPETYKLKLAASPHIAAREENLRISIEEVKEAYHEISLQPGMENMPLVIEGAGGLLVPINEREFIADLAKALPVKLVLVSRNYLGSINHSLLTAEVCKQYKLDVAGWIFNDHFMAYEDEIARWSGFPKITAIPCAAEITPAFIREQALRTGEALKKLL